MLVLLGLFFLTRAGVSVCCRWAHPVSVVRVSKRPSCAYFHAVATANHFSRRLRFTSPVYSGGWDDVRAVSGWRSCDRLSGAYAFMASVFAEVGALCASLWKPWTWCPRCLVFCDLRHSVFWSPLSSV